MIFKKLIKILSLRQISDILEISITDTLQGLLNDTELLQSQVILLSEPNRQKDSLT